MNHRIAIILALIIVIAALAPAIAASPIISIGSYTAEVSSNVIVPVKITNASAVAGGSVKITFNPAIVNVQSVTPGDFGTLTSNINNANGSLRVAASRVTTIGIDEAILANISFLGMSEGYTALNIQNAILNFEDGNATTPETSDGSINVYVYNNNNASPTPTPTPTPSPSPSPFPDDTETDTGATAESGSGSGSPGGHDYADSATTGETENITLASSNANEVNAPLSITIGSFTTYVNTNVTVPIELLNANDIAGGSAKITFNPTIVIAKEVLPGDFGTPIANINNSAGFVYIACASPTAVGKETAKLASIASITFEGLSEGLSSLDIQDATLNDEHGSLITPETTSNGEINVGARTRTPSPPHLPAADSTTTIIALFAFSAIVIALIYIIGNYKLKKKS
ncbi:MAG: hypothetical protein ISS94_02285 [Candidatus Syntrophoarchaeum sp.]|nr:hypothetical protein [Candidatus Syntrophoarchaeum sp.]